MPIVNSINLDISQYSGSYTIKGGTGTRKSIVINGPATSANDVAFSYSNGITFIGGAANATLTLPSGTGTIISTNASSPVTFDSSNARFGINSPVPGANLDVSGTVAGTILFRLKQPVSASASIMDAQTSGGTSVFNIDSTGIIKASGYKTSLGNTGGSGSTAGIVFENGLYVSGSISAGAIAWTTISASQTGVVNNGYFTNGASRLVITLPAVSTVGQSIHIVGINATNGWKVAQQMGGQIRIGSSATSLGFSGYIESSNSYDSVRLISTGGTVWYVIDYIGTITVV